MLSIVLFYCVTGLLYLAVALLLGAAYWLREIAITKAERAAADELSWILIGASVVLLGLVTPALLNIFQSSLTFQIVCLTLTYYALCYRQLPAALHRCLDRAKLKALPPA